MLLLVKLFSVFLVSILSVVSHAQTTTKIPLEYFAQLPEVKNPVLSPNGTQLASTVILGGKPVLIIKPFDTLFSKQNKMPAIIGSGDLFINWYEFANEERLVINVRATAGVGGRLWNLSRLVSSSVKGKDLKPFHVRANDFGYYRQLVDVIHWLPDDPDHVLAILNDTPDKWASPEVDLVNINTGKAKTVLKNTKGSQRWIADADGNLRIGVKIDTRLGRRNVTVYYRETIKSKWEELQKTDYFDNKRLVPYRFDEDDSNILLVSIDELNDSSDIDETERNLFRYDLTLRDVVGPYKNNYREKVINIVEKALPNTELDIVSESLEKDKYVFRSYSDVKPPEYQLLNLKEPSLKYLGSEYSELENYTLASMESVSYKARDGLEIPAFLTLPVGAEKENLPLVVYPHGGPWAHDEWGFDNYVQFMASRGYAVFQPQFRGSTNYGIEHEEAGYKQWGYAIQDDITDGVQWLIDEGVVDPERICIVGSSFGGYAAAVGIAKTPELYQCAVSINGVFNLKSFIDSSRQLLYKTINRAMWNNRDEAEAVSPYHLVDNIKAPLLIIAGTRDTVVPYKQSKKMYKKMKKAGKDVELIKLTDGEHWRTNEKHEIKKMEALERFLDEHIGG